MCKFIYLATLLCICLGYGFNVLAEGELSKLERTKALMQQGPQPQGQSAVMLEGAPTRMFQGLAFALAVFCAGIYLTKKFRRITPNTMRKLRIIERCPLTSKNMLVLVEVEGRKLVVGLGSDNMTFFCAEQRPQFDLTEIKEEVCEESIRLAS